LNSHLLTEAGLSGRRLADAYEDCASDMFRQFAAALSGDIDEAPGVSRHYTSPDHFMFRGAWNARLTPETADAAIEETIAWFKARGADRFGWWTHASTTPDDIGHRLISHGFKALYPRGGVLDPNVPTVEQGPPVMAGDLHLIDVSAVEKAPPGFRVEQAVTDDALEAFQCIVAEGFTANPLVGHAWAEATRAAGFERAPWRIYVGWLDGEPVATNVVTEGGGIVGVWNIATLSTQRGKGIGAAITVAPLLEARAKGYRYAGLFASALGAPVYQRLGFEFTGTKLNRYVWSSAR
jgi:GNAT superfamily N-acetyltransferase